MPYFSENDLNEKVLKYILAMDPLKGITTRREQEQGPVLLYCYLSSSSFVIQDIGSLQESYTVKVFHFEPSPKILLPVSFLKQLFFLLGKYSFSININVPVFRISLNAACCFRENIS